MVRTSWLWSQVIDNLHGDGDVMPGRESGPVSVTFPVSRYQTYPGTQSQVIRPTPLSPTDLGGESSAEIGNEV